MVPHSAAAAAQVMVRAGEGAVCRTACAARLIFQSIEATKDVTPRRPASIQTSR